MADSGQLPLPLLIARHLVSLFREGIISFAEHLMYTCRDRSIQSEFLALISSVAEDAREASQIQGNGINSVLARNAFNACAAL